jgi:hypothetical protein
LSEALRAFGYVFQWHENTDVPVFGGNIAEKSHTYVSIYLKGERAIPSFAESFLDIFLFEAADDIGPVQKVKETVFFLFCKRFDAAGFQNITAVTGDQC